MAESHFQLVVVVAPLQFQGGLLAWSSRRGGAVEDELVEGGRDHPGPVIVVRWPSAVSFAVTSLECEDAV